ncbi:hypothetical protein [Candidatus Cardinium hertigii]|uniref:hypothetical protein n=2 Tax=Candidatus Cardinium TaxID=273135 RepID=UPI001FAA0015|nr:hypothetical protein [Candidatus Cardinium hertigii]
MPYAKQAPKFFFLVLWLQALTWCKNHPKHAPIPIIYEASDKQLPLADQAKENALYKPNKDADWYPEFDAKFHFDPDFNRPPKAGYVLNKADNTQANVACNADYGSNDHVQMPAIEPRLHPSDQSKNKLIFDFERLIKQMRQEADARRNIIWDVKGNRLTRVVSNISHSSISLYTPEDYVVQGLNIYRAAAKICRLYGQGSAVFEQKAHEFMKYYSDCSEQTEEFWINTTKKINQAVVLHLQKRLFNDKALNLINEKLRLAENYVGLDDTHYNVTTIFTIQNHKFALEDKQAFKLTDQQKNDYINRKKQTWYSHLDPLETLFLNAYVNKFLDGNHYIPTQLRKIPGLRNAYQKSLWKYDKNHQKKLLATYYHSGSLASPIQYKDQNSRRADWQITKDNWNQVQQKDKNIEVLSLNYNMNVPGFDNLQEKKIVQDTTEIVGADRLMNLSINGIGTSSNVYDKYIQLVGYIVSFYEKQYPILCASFTNELKDKTFFRKSIKFLNKNSKESRDQKIKHIKNPKDKRFFELLIALEKRVKGSATWHNLKQTKALINGNPNATTCAIYIAFIAFMGSLNQDKIIPTILFNCKSGKDRTGLMSLLVDAYIILMRCPSLTQDEVINVLIHTGHYQLLAAINGGMAGRFGLKPVQADQVTRNGTAQLFTKAARLTEIDLIKQQVETIA